MFRRRLSPDLVRRAFALAILAAIGLILITGLLLLTERQGLLHTSYEAVSAFGTVGLSIGITGPGTPGAVLWTETVGMLLGRLEFFVVLASAAKLVIDLHRMARNQDARR